ncbi:hypothetical protein D8I24_0572 (plasmid) [Cupriavidus necator H850]|nr:hypothetical protein D8I24_0572 [Cupriavidus necator H850]
MNEATTALTRAGPTNFYPLVFAQPNPACALR